MLPAYDCGDYLYPSVEVYKVMGSAIPLKFFAHLSAPPSGTFDFNWSMNTETA